MSLVSQAKNILMTPQSEWPIIAVEGATITSLYSEYIMPLAAIPSVFTFLSLALGGFGVVSGLVAGLAKFIMTLIAVLVTSLAAAKLAPHFGGKDNLLQGLKLMGYSYTPILVAGVFLILPRGGMLLWLIAGLYGLYLFYLGSSPVMGIPQDKSVIYTVVMIAVGFAVGLVLGFIFMPLLGAMAIGSMY